MKKKYPITLSITAIFVAFFNKFLLKKTFCFRFYKKMLYIVLSIG